MSCSCGSGRSSSGPAQVIFTDTASMSRSRAVAPDEALGLLGKLGTSVFQPAATGTNWLLWFLGAIAVGVIVHELVE